ncbi:hypothetical protein [Bowmanella dokdonensis]|uniref:Uncharacterized protein n=1 Tax=Bowmanella dokdonensis TaxID=751969 RepID=A0A939DLW9_9ALTE|nr:hypothetical protein [Bowmanella dokdonensis]MBN7824979.1 hypothetical protein [Bowmanella dokdonensis]
MRNCTHTFLTIAGLLLASHLAVADTQEFSRHTFTYHLDTQIDLVQFNYLQCEQSLRDDLDRDIQDQVTENLEEFGSHKLLAAYLPVHKQALPSTE